MKKVDDLSTKKTMTVTKMMTVAAIMTVTLTKSRISDDRPNETRKNQQHSSVIAVDYEYDGDDDNGDDAVQLVFRVRIGRVSC